MRSAGRKNRPSASVTRSTTVPLAGCVAVTVAPGSTPPELSLTTPPISPVLVCAAATVTNIEEHHTQFASVCLLRVPSRKLLHAILQRSRFIDLQFRALKRL